MKFKSGNPLRLCVFASLREVYIFRGGFARAILQRSIFFKSVHRPGDAIFHEDLAEIQQKTQLAPAQTQVRLDLFAVSGRGGLHRLQLEDHLSLNHDVRPKAFVELHSIVFDRNGHLPLDRKATALQFVSQNHLVYGLEQAWSQRSVHTDGRINDDFPYLILGHSLA